MATATSPYLRQHADNPVDWWPWCQEAFDEARRRDLPVLVSIGYSTCHWCHVMAHESFSDESVASRMNTALICIKVDREEHPEVDAVYMEAAQSLVGQGGWPLNVFVDADGRPFFAVTYLPPQQWDGLLARVQRIWSEQRAQLAQQAGVMAAHLRAADAPIEPAVLPDSVWDVLDGQVGQAYDRRDPGLAWGGPSQPKFPPHALLHLMISSGRPGHLERAAAILAAMQDAGIHDRVGGGFHRYSVTRDWRVPHFEKMLYDQAQLIGAYSRASLALGRDDFLATARHAAEYLDRDMRILAGGSFEGYAAAEDADDPGGEGAFYAWTPAELEQLLGHADGRRLAAEWGITAAPRTSGPSGHPEPAPGQIPHPRGAGTVTQAQRASWEALLPVLRSHRDRRPRPGRDDKVITEWNALALHGLSWLSRATGDAVDRARVLALAAALRRRFQDGVLLRLPGRHGLLPDYGAAVLGFAEAFAATGDGALLEAAEQIAAAARRTFGDGNGGFLLAPVGGATSLRRGRDILDGATPSGQGVLALGAGRACGVSGNAETRAIAEEAVVSGAGQAGRMPVSAATLLHAWHLLREGPLTAVVTGPAADPRTEALLAAARRMWDGRLSIVPVDACRDRTWPCLEQRRDLPDPHVLVCTATACLAPVTDTAALPSLLARS